MTRFVSVAITFVAVFLALAAAELALRLGGWGVDAAKAHASLLSYDATIGWTKIPSGSAVYRWAGSRIRETSNSFGGRGPELDQAAAMNRRVLFLGDSFCEGYLVGDDKVFSFVLGRLRPSLQAINLGVAGYSTDQELLLYEREGARLKPQLVVLLFFDNDVWFNSVTHEYRASKPLFEMTEGGLRLTGVPVPRPDRSIAAAPCAGCPSSLRLLLLAQRARLRVARAPHGASGAQPIADELQVYRLSEPPGIQKAWRLTEALLKHFREAIGDRLMIFYVPSVAAIYDESWQQTSRFYGMDEGWDIHLPERRLAAICDRLGIPLISPTSRFREVARQGKILYFMQDGHWNANGHRLVADILAPRVASSPGAKGANEGAYAACYNPRFTRVPCYNQHPSTRATKRTEPFGPRRIASSAW